MQDITKDDLIKAKRNWQLALTAATTQSEKDECKDTIRALARRIEAFEKAGK